MSVDEALQTIEKNTDLKASYMLVFAEITQLRAQLSEALSELGMAQRTIAADSRAILSRDASLEEACSLMREMVEGLKPIRKLASDQIHLNEYNVAECRSCGADLGPRGQHRAGCLVAAVLDFTK